MMKDDKILKFLNFHPLSFILLQQPAFFHPQISFED